MPHAAAAAAPGTCPISVMNGIPNDRAGVVLILI
jgi:hypothetical protein